MLIDFEILSVLVLGNGSNSKEKGLFGVENRTCFDRDRDHVQRNAEEMGHEQRESVTCDELTLFSCLIFFFSASVSFVLVVLSIAIFV